MHWAAELTSVYLMVDSVVALEHKDLPDQLVQLDQPVLQDPLDNPQLLLVLALQWVGRLILLRHELV